MTMDNPATANPMHEGSLASFPSEPANNVRSDADLQERVAALEIRVRVLDTLVNDLYHRLISADAAPLVAELDEAVQAVLAQSGMTEDELADAFDFTHR